MERRPVLPAVAVALTRDSRTQDDARQSDRDAATPEAVEHRARTQPGSALRSEERRGTTPSRRLRAPAAEAARPCRAAASSRRRPSDRRRRARFSSPAATADVELAEPLPTLVARRRGAAAGRAGASHPDIDRLSLIHI